MDKQSVWDRTPQARYSRDNNFRVLVDIMEAHMHNASYTPTEMREAAMLAAIHYESRTIRQFAGYTMNPMETADAMSRIRELEEIISRHHPDRYPTPGSQEWYAEQERVMRGECSAYQGNGLGQQKAP